MKNNNNQYVGYIYKISNNINDKVYIGQTTTTIKYRWNQHRSMGNNERYNSILYRAMRKYGRDNFYIECIEKIICDTKEELRNSLNEREIYYISEYGSLNPDGYNLTIGGKNMAEHIKRPVDAYDARGNLCLSFNSITDAGKYLNTSAFTHISGCCNGTIASACGYIWRYHEDSFDKYPVRTTQENLDKIGSDVPVDQYTLEGEFITSHSNIQTALHSIGKLDGGTPITLCCRGLQNKAYNYVWRFKGHSFDEFKETHKDWTPIDVYSMNGKLIGEYPSINEAIRQLNLNTVYSNIQKNLNGVTKQHLGYVWRRHGDSFFKYGNPNIKKKKETKPINKYSLDDIYIDTYKSANSYAKMNGLAGGSYILETIRFKDHIAYGYKWFYADDPNQPDKSKIILKDNEQFAEKVS